MTNKITISGLISKNWKKAIIMIVLISITSFFSSYPLNLLKKVVDSANNGIKDDIIKYAILYLCFQLIQILFHNITNYFNYSTQSFLAHKLRFDIYKHLGSLHQDFFDNNDSSEMLNKLIQDSDIVIRGFIVPITYVSRSLFSFAFGFYFMCQINWKLTLIIFPLAAVSGIVARLTGGVFRKYAKENRARNTKMWQKYHENIKGIRDVHSCNQEDAKAKEVENTSLSVLSNVRKTQKYGGFVNALHSFFFVAIITLMLSVGGVMVINKEVTIGGLAAILMYNSLLSDPIANFISMFIEFQGINTSLERINKIMLIPIDEAYRNPRRELDIESAKTAIEFDSVSFNYNDKPTLFDNLTFKIAANKSYAFAGATGSGKTSILKLTEGYYPINDGTIKIYDYELNALNKLSLRNNIGYVFQDTFLFNTTLKENIVFANPNYSDEDLKMALEISCVNEIIDKLPQGMNTVIGENGVKMSGGERQRIGIARVLLRKPRLLLLDEATSALDNNTEQKVINGIKKQFKNSTIVMIAHRLSTIENVDKIFLLENGKIIECGSHTELLNLNGKYRSMHDANLLYKEDISEI